jgi:hypothetical protein
MLRIFILIPFLVTANISFALYTLLNARCVPICPEASKNNGLSANYEALFAEKDSHLGHQVTKIVAPREFARLH